MPFRWLFESGQKTTSCLDLLSHEEWLNFVFDHPVAKKNEERWYCLEAAENYYYKDIRLFLNRLTRLMQEPENLLTRFTPEQIRQGFWCFISGFELPDALEEKSIEFPVRRDCINAIPTLYSRLFQRPGFEKAAFMYWDPLTYPFHDLQGMPRDADQALLQDAMFEALCKILNMADRSCFLGALHGLGHLRHPRGEMAIREILGRRSTVSEKDMAYALACIRGDMDSGPSPLAD